MWKCSVWMTVLGLAACGTTTSSGGGEPTDVTTDVQVDASDIAGDSVNDTAATDATADSGVDAVSDAVAPDVTLDAQVDDDVDEGHGLLRRPRCAAALARLGRTRLTSTVAARRRRRSGLRADLR